jgi:hypothetical protein
MRSYYRLQKPGDDAEDLLDPHEQVTEPWGGTVYGRCDKCGGTGHTSHVGEGGELECPACEGSGEIDDSAREGVSVFPELDGLYRYMVRRDAELDEGTSVVELEGVPSEDSDFDADEGALLVNPTRIVSVRPLDRDRIRELRRDAAAR